MLETEMRKQFAACCAASLPNVRVFIRNVGFFKTPGGGGFRAGIKGQADLTGVFKTTVSPLPCPLEIELKRYGEKLTPEQETWRDWCREWNIPWLLLEEKKRNEADGAFPRWIDETRAFLERHGYNAAA